jgi:hypothetical protein
MTSSSILHRKYTTWLAERGYQPMTADELSRQIQGDKPRDQFAADKLSDVQWLDRFIREWNDAADCGDAGAGPASGGPLSISTFTRQLVQYFQLTRDMTGAEKRSYVPSIQTPRVSCVLGRNPPTARHSIRNRNLLTGSNSPSGIKLPSK